MSHLAVGEVSETLRHTLWLGLRADLVTRQLVTSEQNIVLANPGQVALPQGVVPIVRICSGEFAEGTRALDNGALGLVIPHVDTPDQARALVEAFRFAPMGHRSTGGTNAQFGYRPPAAAEAQKILNAEILIIPMIETPLAVENAEAIAAIAGIDALLIGTNDLSLEMGIPGQVGHERVREAYAKVADACRRHQKVLGMGGVYDQEIASRYIGMGARLILGGNDHGLLMDAATRRAQFLRGTCVILGFHPEARAGHRGAPFVGDADGVQQESAIGALLRGHLGRQGNAGQGNRLGRARVSQDDAGSAGINYSEASRAPWEPLGGPHVRRKARPTLVLRRESRPLDPGRGGPARDRGGRLVLGEARQGGAAT